MPIIKVLLAHPNNPPAVPMTVDTSTLYGPQTTIDDYIAYYQSFGFTVTLLGVEGVPQGAEVFEPAPAPLDVNTAQPPVDITSELYPVAEASLTPWLIGGALLFFLIRRRHP